MCGCVYITRLCLFQMCSPNELQPPLRPKDVEKQMEKLHTSHQKDCEHYNTVQEIGLLQELHVVELELTSEKLLSQDLKKKKMEVEKQLQLKKEELQSLSAVHQKDSEKLCNKETEIGVLQQHLQAVQNDLSCERKLSREMVREVEKKLQLKKEELELLHTGYQHDSDQLQIIIKNKEEKVRKFQVIFC